MKKALDSFLRILPEGLGGRPSERGSQEGGPLAAQAGEASGWQPEPPPVGTEIEEGYDLVQIGEVHPCQGCPAPCCKLVIFPQERPESFMGMDYLRFVLLHGSKEAILSENGALAIGVWSDCRLLGTNPIRCTVHQLPEQPKTCYYYNPYRCYYKRNFVGQGEIELIRLNLPRFEAWFKAFRFDQNGKIIFAPDFARTRQIVSGIPLDVKLRMAE